MNVGIWGEPTAGGEGKPSHGTYLRVDSGPYDLWEDLPPEFWKELKAAHKRFFKEQKRLSHPHYSK